MKCAGADASAASGAHLVNKQVLATLVRGDEAIALCAVEPAGGGWPLGRAQPSRSSKALAQGPGCSAWPDSCAGGEG